MEIKSEKHTFNLWGVQFKTNFPPIDRYMQFVHQGRMLFNRMALSQQGKPVKQLRHIGVNGSVVCKSIAMLAAGFPQINTTEIFVEPDVVEQIEWARKAEKAKQIVASKKKLPIAAGEQAYSLYTSTHNYSTNGQTQISPLAGSIIEKDENSGDYVEVASVNVIERDPIEITCENDIFDQRVVAIETATDEYGREIVFYLEFIRHKVNYFPWYACEVKLYCRYAKNSTEVDGEEDVYTTEPVLIGTTVQLDVGFETRGGSIKIVPHKRLVLVSFGTLLFGVSYTPVNEFDYRSKALRFKTDEKGKEVGIDKLFGSPVSYYSAPIMEARGGITSIVVYYEDILSKEDQDKEEQPVGTGEAVFFLQLASVNETDGYFKIYKLNEEDYSSNELISITSLALDDINCYLIDAAMVKMVADLRDGLWIVYSGRVPSSQYFATLLQRQANWLSNPSQFSLSTTPTAITESSFSMYDACVDYYSGDIYLAGSEFFFQASAGEVKKVDIDTHSIVDVINLWADQSPFSSIASSMTKTGNDSLKEIYGEELLELFRRLLGKEEGEEITAADIQIIENIPIESILDAFGVEI